MLLISVGAGVAAWFVFMTLLRRLLLQPDLMGGAKIWFGASMVLIAALFALAATFCLAAFDKGFFHLHVFTLMFFLFLILSVLTGAHCARKAAK
jgi:uncharacterized membrane protein YfhO